MEITSTSHWKFPRHKAAFRRSRLSSPMSLAIEKGIIMPDTSVFDYGTGKGDCVNLLNQMGISASGYDPYWHPNNKIESADVVTLCYVLGVIESPLERDEVLKRAWSLATSCLIVACQVQHSRGSKAWGDGYLTNWRTFIRYWTEPQLRQYVEKITGAKARRIGKGVLVISKPIENVEAIAA